VADGQKPLAMRKTLIVEAFLLVTLFYFYFLFLKPNKTVFNVHNGIIHTPHRSNSRVADGQKSLALRKTITVESFLLPPPSPPPPIFC